MGPLHTHTHVWAHTQHTNTHTRVLMQCPSAGCQVTRADPRRCSGWPCSPVAAASHSPSALATEGSRLARTAPVLASVSVRVWGEWPEHRRDPRPPPRPSRFPHAVAHGPRAWQASARPAPCTLAMWRHGGRRPGASWGCVQPHAGPVCACGACTRLSVNACACTHVHTRAHACVCVCTRMCAHVSDSRGLCRLLVGMRPPSTPSVWAEPPDSQL